MSRFSDYLFFRKHHVCPRWLCFTFDNIFRQLFQNPHEILKPLVKEGDVVLDIGPGIGYFTIPLAEIVGAAGQVIAADIQEAMLSAIGERAARQGLRERIVLQRVSPDSLGMHRQVDFILAFWMVHEVPDKRRFLKELHALLKDGGTFLMVEPKLHLSKASFAETVKLSAEAGFVPAQEPTVAFSMSVLFTKGRAPSS